MTNGGEPSLTRRWRILGRAIAGRFGTVQTLMILVLTYAMLIGPVGIGIAIGRRDLLAKRGLKHAGSAWQDADTAKPDFERAKLLS